MDHPTIALATCAQLPEPDPDHEPLAQALKHAGLAHVMVAWDGGAAARDALAGAQLCVLRSTWNYPQQHQDFLDWLHEAASCCPVVNPPELVRWNIHKGYLAQLGTAGIPVAPTVFVSRGERAKLAEETFKRSWEDIVVKPAISAASFRTQRFARSELKGAQRFLDGLTSERDALVQQYLPSVETTGELSIVWIAGKITHGVRKAPRFVGEIERVDPHAADIASDELNLAQRVIETARSLQPAMDRALYARIDIMRDVSGDPVLSELELIEPSLFFNQCSAALTRFVDRLIARKH